MHLTELLARYAGRFSNCMDLHSIAKLQGRPLPAILAALNEISLAHGDGAASQAIETLGSRYGRTDLQLLAALSPRAAFGLPRVHRELASNVMACFRSDELTVSLARVFATASHTKLALFASWLNGQERDELCNALTNVSFPGITTDWPLVHICIPAVCVALEHRQRDAPPVTAQTLNGFVTRFESFLSNFTVGRHGISCSHDGSLTYVKPRKAGGWPADGEPMLLTISILCAIQSILSFFWADATSASGYSPAQLNELINRAREVQWVCWRTIRTMRAIQNDTGEYAADFELEWLEAVALAQLAQFERLRRGHARALQYSIGAFAIVERLEGVRSHGELFRSIEDYLTAQGMKVPKVKTSHAKTVQATPWLKDEPSLALRAACSDAVIERSCSELGAAGFSPTGWGWETCLRVAGSVYSPSLRAAAFQILVSMGGAYEARRFFHMAKHEEQANPVHEKKMKDVRDETALRVGFPGLLRWCDAVAVNSQGAVMWLVRGRQPTIRAGLRKLTARLYDQTRSDPGARQLFVNHVRVGMSYHARRVHHGGYAGYIDDARDAVDAMVEAADRGQLEPLTHLDFKTHEIPVRKGEVFVSVVTDDGASLRLVFRSQSHEDIVIHPHVDGRDWIPFLTEFEGVAARQIDVAAAHGSTLAKKIGLVEIPKALLSLSKAIYTTAARLVSSEHATLKRILLHADPLWNVVPWQYVHQKSFESEPESARRAGARVAYWRVPGVQLSRTSSAATVLLKSSRAIAGDVDLDDIATQIGAQRKQRGPRSGSRGMLSVLAHGGVGPGHATFSLNGKAVSMRTLAELGQYQLVFLHVCHGSGVNSANLHESDDILGAPGEILQGGAKVVLASGVPLLTEHILDLESRFLDFDPQVDLAPDPSSGRDEWDSIQERYLVACQFSDQAVSLYTLFSEAIAPALCLREKRL